MSEHWIKAARLMPALPAALSLGLGVLLVWFTDWPFQGFYCTLFIASISLLAATFSFLWRRFLPAAVVVIFFLLGAHISAKELFRGEDFSPSPETISVHASVAKTLSSGPGFRVLLLEQGMIASTKFHLPGAGRLHVRDNPVELSAGDRVAFRSRLRKPINRGNPGEFDWELDCRNNGILWLASVRGTDSVLVLSRGSPNHPTAWVFRARQALTQFLDAHSGKLFQSNTGWEVQAILRGIVVGDMGEISPALYRSFADSGLVHALSASGVHVAIVGFLVALTVKAVGYACPRVYLRFPFKHLWAFTSIPAIIGYCFLVGARVPAIRSTIMGLVIAMAILLSRRWYSLNSVLFAAMVVVLIYPLSILTPSFQLSFLAVLGIMLVVEGAQRTEGDARTAEGSIPDHILRDSSSGSFGIRYKLRQVGRSLKMLALGSTAATLAITPLVLQYFHSFPVYGLPANLLTDCMMTGALAFGLAASLMGCISPHVGSLLIIPADLLAAAVISTSEFFANLPGSTIKVAHMDIPQLLLVTGTAWSLVWVISRRSRASFACVLSASLMLLAYSAFDGVTHSGAKDLNVVFLNVGKGDAAVFSTPGKKTVLIDGGIANEYFDAGQAIVLPFLEWRGVRSLDGVVMSHPDMDHMGGLLSVIDTFPASRFWWNPAGTRAQHLETLLTSAAKSGASVHPVSMRSVPVWLGEAKVTFLNNPAPNIPQGGRRLNINDLSVVCRLDYGDVSFLFPGDIQATCEDELLSRGVPLRATVLKVAHHGSKAGTTRRFLEAVRPEIAVISAEYPPSRGLPNPEVIDRLLFAGAQVFWTGRDGAVTLRTDGTAITGISRGRGRKSR